MLGDAEKYEIGNMQIITDASAHADTELLRQQCGWPDRGDSARSICCRAIDFEMSNRSVVVRVLIALITPVTTPVHECRDCPR